MAKGGKNNVKVWKTGVTRVCEGAEKISEGEDDRQREVMV